MANFLKHLRSSSDCLFVAEVGQNHQGQLDVALEYVRSLAQAGADVIKFQKRDLGYLFDEASLSRPYSNANSFGPTYGQHRLALELDSDELEILRDACHEEGVLFACTAFDEPTVDVLAEIKVDIIKLASFDCGNLSLLERAMATNIPIIFSTGGATVEHIRPMVEKLAGSQYDFALLHCVSQYPTSESELHLAQVSRLSSLFPSSTIGLSDHFSGTLSGPIAFMEGARVFEKHVSLDRSWKGTDHGFSLEPTGFSKFVRDVKRVESMLGGEAAFETGSETIFQKLGKSITAARNLEEGAVIDLADLRGQILAEEGIPVREMYSLIGRVTKRAISAGDALEWSFID